MTPDCAPLSGRELDRAIAEQVMGWKCAGKNWSTKPAHRPSKDYPGQIINDWDGKGEHDFLLDPTDDMKRVAFCGCESTVEIPAFSSNPVAMLQVIERIQEHQTKILIEIEQGYDSAYCRVRIYDPLGIKVIGEGTDTTKCVEGKRPPLNICRAVCLAALAALKAGG